MTTSAALSPARVISACHRALTDIATDRQNALLALAASWANRSFITRWWTMPLYGAEAFVMRMPEFYRITAMRHRALDHAKATALLDLAKAVYADDKTLRIDVSADDFAVIRPYYVAEE